MRAAALSHSRTRRPAGRAPTGVPLELELTEEALEQLLPVSGDLDAPPDDLSQLEGISTGPVLHTLRVRYGADRIYTAVGPVVIAVNPFRPTAESSAERIASLATAEPDSLPPHVFNVARSAYSVMVTTGGAQAILISGESGAGKTETAKLCMSCLATLSSSSPAATAAALESGLLLEGFGNARTTHNDNSSRFGKWVEVRAEAATRARAMPARAPPPRAPHKPGPIPRPPPSPHTLRTPS